MMRRERQSFLDLRCGYGQKLALGGDFYGTSYHGMENGGEQQQYFHKTFESSPRIGHIFCSRCYVRYVLLLLLLLKQSIRNI
jgi:hypothetical protein